MNTDAYYIRHSLVTESGVARGSDLRRDYETTAGLPLVIYLGTMANVYMHCGVSGGRNNVNANLLLFDYSIRIRALRADVNTI